VHYERLVIQAGDNSFTLDLHPRLTVIAGLGRLERESLIGELIGALGSSRSGVHAELTQDDGRHLAVFRPDGGRHRIVDIDAAADVSGEFRTPDGRIDLLELNGLDTRTARRRMRLSAADLTQGSQSSQIVRQLGGLNQQDLWNLAFQYQQADEVLQNEAEAVGSAPEDAEVIERIEQRHQEFEAAQSRHESVRHHTIFTSVACVLGAIPAVLMNRLYGLPFLAVAAIMVLLSVIFRRGMEKAEVAQLSALTEAGAQSYLGFHLQRVNGLLSSDAARKRLVGAAEDQRTAAKLWKDMVGDISVDWAVEHRDEIVATSRLQVEVNALGALAHDLPRYDEDHTTELTRVLVSRMSELKQLGVHGESFPLILDETFVGVDSAVKPALLELVGHAAGSPQLIVLTEDEDVASWARLEALTGALSIIEPTPDHHEPERRPAEARESHLVA
jgi:hypothetical protein